MTFRLDAYCGLYCGACFVMIAYKQDRTDCIPKKWLSFIHDMELKCHGCKSDVLFENCRGCKSRPCAQSKNIEFCDQCSEYPCEQFRRIASYNLPHHNVAVQSLKKIDEIGVKEWLKQQSERWLCSNCNSAFSWYEEYCIKCGEQLFNSVREAEQLNKLK